MTTVTSTAYLDNSSMRVIRILQGDQFVEKPNTKMSRVLLEKNITCYRILYQRIHSGL